MKHARTWLLSAVLAVAIAALAVTMWDRREPPTYLTVDAEEFFATFEPPPARDSATTRRELDELLELQRTRTPAQVAAARADRKTDVERFNAALGLDEGVVLPRLRMFTRTVENDIHPYMRAAKIRFHRQRPFQVEPRLEPCVDGVRSDLSYPSGHAAYGYAIADVLTELVPERKAQLRARADEFARQRMVCSVHFRTDLEAGRRGAEWLVARMHASGQFRADARHAEAELRAALKLAPRAATN